MATRTKTAAKPAKTAAKPAKNTQKGNKPELATIGSAMISDIRETWSDGDTVLFNCVIFNSIQLYGLTARFNDDGEMWVAMPSRKGTDGKYYKYFYLVFEPEALEKIEAALFPEG